MLDALERLELLLDELDGRLELLLEDEVAAFELILELLLELLLEDEVAAFEVILVFELELTNPGLDTELTDNELDEDRLDDRPTELGWLDIVLEDVVDERTFDLVSPPPQPTSARISSRTFIAQ
jgi:hypothetical protein